MNGVAGLLDQIRTRGFSLQLVNAKVRIQGSKQPEGESLALIHELRQRREEVKAFLTEASSKPIELRQSTSPPSLGCKCAASIYKQLLLDGDGFDWMCSRCGQTLHVPEAPASGGDRAWLIEDVLDDRTGKLRAFKVCSAVLESELWVLSDRSFIPPDYNAVFFDDELPFLKRKTLSELKEVLKVKVVFPGARVIQEPNYGD
jgi:hypothetical protein